MKRVLVGLALGLAFCGAVLYGFGIHARHWFPYGPAKDLYRRLHSEGGLLQGSRSGAEATRLARRDVVGKLSQLPYLQGYNPASGRQGVTLYDPDRAYAGWNLCVSAHAAEAQLLDMRGVVHHRWAFGAGRLWPGLKVSEERFEHDNYWNRALLLPGGDLLVVWEYVGMARLDRGSHLKWAVRNAANHDLAVDREGRIYTLTRRIRIRPDINPDTPIFEDFVTILSPEGKTLQEISLLRSFEESDYAPELAAMADEGDVFHANAVQVLDGSLAARNPSFREGNLLVSIRALSIVAVLDPRLQKIVWAMSGQWRGQHTPRLLESGTLLMFDNFGKMRVGQSRVLEVDPFTQQVVWRYGEGEKEQIFSESHGVVQRLPNGDTLIVESNNGRAFEVTPKGEAVWEYVNPYRAGAKQDLVATLLQVERLDPRTPTDWAERAGGGPP